MLSIEARVGRTGADRRVDGAGDWQPLELPVGCAEPLRRGPCTLANRLINQGAAYSAKRADVPEPQIRRPAPASRTSRTVRSWRPSISTALLASLSPPGVNASRRRCGEELVAQLPVRAGPRAADSTRP